jgi:flavin reductase ActVB
MTADLRLIDAEPRGATAGGFADAMSALAGGVAIVTCRLGDRPWGTTVTAFTSVSADPPTVLVSLGAETTAARAIAATRRFGVSILGRGQLDAARYASAPGAAKFLEPFTDPREARSESPAVAGALAHLDCELSDEVQIADHTVFFGRVLDARVAPGGAPLVYFRREYRTVADPPEGQTPIRRRDACLSS